ncbi:DMT family transporter [Bradyrhizobium arachidis]|uniref:DMT family transporter n=1 Tax=Bradyrhizobium arachidis TaxID=858423 RepID=UPI002162690C|nr:DMT family transporter [Bradyrhizobium arachidis]UVO32656.1 DMT family transporter [Bradyrhizobium arachidis]
MTALLFITVVLAWGFTWFAIKLQLGVVAPEVSILWRFVLATALIWAGLAATGRLQRVDPRQHGWFAAMGVCLFCLNYILTYAAIGHIASGVASVIVTTVTIFNPLNQWLFRRQRPSRQVLGAALLGMIGIMLLFGEAFAGVAVDAGTALGVALQLAAALVFSLGNFASLRATADGTDLPNAVARAMSWGTVFLALFCLARGAAFVIAPSPGYLLSLLYLAVVGTIAAFLAYLSLLARLGADRAAYVTVLYPAVALAVSSSFEAYHWSLWSITGLALVGLGNIVLFLRLPPSRAATWERASTQA